MQANQLAGIALTGKGQEEVLILDYEWGYPGPDEATAINKDYANKGVVFDKITPEAVELLLPDLQVKWVAIMVDQDSAKVLQEGDRSSVQIDFYVSVLLKTG